MKGATPSTRASRHSDRSRPIRPTQAARRASISVTRPIGSNSSDRSAQELPRKTGGGGAGVARRGGRAEGAASRATRRAARRSASSSGPSKWAPDREGSIDRSGLRPWSIPGGGSADRRAIRIPPWPGAGERKGRDGQQDGRGQAFPRRTAGSTGIHPDSVLARMGRATTGPREPGRRGLASLRPAQIYSGFSDGTSGGSRSSRGWPPCLTTFHGGSTGPRDDPGGPWWPSSSRVPRAAKPRPSRSRSSRTRRRDGRPSRP